MLDSKLTQAIKNKKHAYLRVRLQTDRKLTFAKIEHRKPPPPITGLVVSTINFSKFSPDFCYDC